MLENGEKQGKVWEFCQSGKVGTMKMRENIFVIYCVEIRIKVWNRSMVFGEEVSTSCSHISSRYE